MGPKKTKTGMLGGQTTEVESTFLENQLATLNRKIARLKTTVKDLEIRNEDLQKAYEKLDEDRADLVAYLKKQIKIKTDEIIELKDKIKGLENIREIETKQFQETVVELEKNFVAIKDQFSAENKLLAGKLSTMEEFRAIRDDLMAKFEKQEQDFEEQEINYKRKIYEAEKNFINGKMELKKEMEARLLQLAQDFQDASNLRIAASTHRVIRDNIAINHELDSLLAFESKLSKLAKKNEVDKKAACIAKELAEEERDEAINKNVIQLKVIKRLTSTLDEIKKEKALVAKKHFEFDLLQIKTEDLIKENDNLSLKVRILEQNLYASMTNQHKYVLESSLILRESEKLKCVLKNAANVIRKALKVDEWSLKDQVYIKSHKVIDRKTLLTQLLEIITQHSEINKTNSETETLVSLGGIYKAGDLGFIPKKQESHRKFSSFSEKRGTLDKLSEIKKSSTSSVWSSPVSSLKTIPSVKILSNIENQIITVSESSFFASAKSENVSSDENDQQKPASELNLKDQLEASKLNVEQSIMKDLHLAELSKSNIRVKSIISMSKIRADEVVKNEPDKDKEDEADEDETENDKGVIF